MTWQKQGVDYLRSENDATVKYNFYSDIIIIRVTAQKPRESHIVISTFICRIIFSISTRFRCVDLAPIWEPIWAIYQSLKFKLSPGPAQYKPRNLLWATVVTVCCYKVSDTWHKMLDTFKASHLTQPIHKNLVVHILRKWMTYKYHRY